MDYAIFALDGLDAGMSTTRLAAQDVLAFALRIGPLPGPAG